MTKNIQGLDIVRFLAAILVALFHLGYWVWAFPTGQSGRVGGDIPAMLAFRVIGSFGWVGVEIFFVISGFVIAFSSQNTTARIFLYKRVMRLLPAVLVIAPLSAAAAFAVGAYSGPDVLYRLVRTLCFLPFAPWVDTVYWTLGIEIAFYTCVWGLVVLKLAHRVEQLGLCLGAVSSAFWLWYIIRPDLGLAQNRLLDLALVHHGALFGVGIVLWAAWQRGVTPVRVATIALFVTAAIIQISVRAGVEAAKVGEHSAALLPVAIWGTALAAIIAALHVPINLPRIRILGLMTYPLYLVHNVAGAAVLGTLCRIGVNAYATVVLTIGLAVFLSWITAIHLEPKIRLVLQAFPLLSANPVSQRASL